MRTRLIEAFCVMLLAPLPQFLDFADVARWVRYLTTGNEALVRLPAGESIMVFSPVSYGLTAAAFLAVWGLTLLLTRWLGSKQRPIPLPFRFLLFWGLLGLLSTALRVFAGAPIGFLPLGWAALKFGLGTVLAALVAAVLVRISRPRGVPTQP